MGYRSAKIMETRGFSPLPINKTKRQGALAPCLLTKQGAEAPCVLTKQRDKGLQPLAP